MQSNRAGSFRLFRVSGIDVCVHWSWILVAAYQINDRARLYSSLTWNILEYLTLFLIVLLHEFGHSFACRQVGGTADLIVLWPLGGLAYVRPPQRPGAVLWSTAAGPLVNVVLFVVLFIPLRLAHELDLGIDVHTFLKRVAVLNLVLLVFNLLPIYPMDGGRILRAVLWYMFGRARSLFVATIIGFIAGAGLVAYAFHIQSFLLGLIAAFVLLGCRAGWMEARALSVTAKAPRRAGYACPNCHASPPMAALWRCARCKVTFDTFETHGECPNCHIQFPTTQCIDCGSSHPLSAWHSTVSTVI
jgi:Zn-dependent protease